jgi:PTH1 family peptidyl-tRNA hydrolase
LASLLSKTANWLVVGLGNPGAAYEHTRHNAGFMAIERLANEWQTNYWKLRSSALCSEVKLASPNNTKTKNPEINSDQLIALAKPQTYMNRSGQAIKGLLKHYHASIDRLIVIHDDLDIPNQVIRIKLGGGHGGHNGLRDINDACGANYIRVRIGIGRPPGAMPADRFVLQSLSQAQQDELEVTAAMAAMAVKTIVSEGVIMAQNNFNRESTN